MDGYPAVSAVIANHMFDGWPAHAVVRVGVVFDEVVDRVDVVRHASVTVSRPCVLNKWRAAIFAVTLDE